MSLPLRYPRQPRPSAPAVKTLFYLGTHLPDWLTKVNVPLFVSRRRLTQQKWWPKSVTRWSLDSGGFSELSMNGDWGAVSAAAYVEEVRRWAKQIGGMDWAAIQDWMCEPVIRAKTGKTTTEHQKLTVQSLMDLRRMAPEIQWTPVLQGWENDDYFAHIQMYLRAGVDLRKEPIVGLGSVCRRQATDEIAGIVKRLHAHGLKLHGFGVKTQGLAKVTGLLHSADSLAWSLAGRREGPLPGCTHSACQNCRTFAMRWREKLFEQCKELA
jgi:hypothetical protein